MNNNYYLEQKKNTHLYFQIGEYKYAVNSDHVLEIMKLPALDYPQKLPNNIIGLLKYNNFVINVVDIRFYLNLGLTPYSTHSELLIVKTDEVIFGIITDKIIGISPFDSSLIDQIPFADGNMIIESLYKLKEETISIVNIYAIEKLLKKHADSNVADIDIPGLFPQDPSSIALLTKRAREITEKSSLRIAAGGEQSGNKFLSININRDFYCIPLEYVKEILKNTNITKIPAIPNYIEGVMNLRGAYITVVNLKNLLNLPDIEKNDKNSVVIIKNDDFEIALRVDRINELFEYDNQSIEKNKDSYYDSEFIYDKSLYTILNIDKIMSDKKIFITDM